MKKTKVLLTLACAILLVAASVMGTLAYLTSTDEVTNTFSVGNVKITLDEAPVDSNGKETTGGRVKANSYKLLPGHQYDKDPTIHVDAKSEECYLFVKITNEVAGVEAPNSTTTPTVEAQMTANGWSKLPDTDVWALNVTKKGGESATVFTDFYVNGDVNGTTLATYAGKTIKVVAYAIQKDGFASAAAAWTAANLA